MPSDTAGTGGSKRHSISSDRIQSVARSPADAPAGKERSGSQRAQRHVVGHRGLGARNPSARNLSKLSLAQSARDEDGTPVSRSHANGASLSSPRPKPNVKRNHSQAAIITRNQSSSGLRKNHSSGHLSRNASAKTLSKASRPEYRRANSQPHPPTHKTRRRSSPPPQPKQPSVRFDVGDDGEDDDAEEMEGVDDGWTEESASQSPSTTRDNTRSNTRANSVVLDESKTDTESQTDGKPQSSYEDDKSAYSKKVHILTPILTAESKEEHMPSSYMEHAEPKPPDADAVARRLLQRQASVIAPPQLSSVSASATPTHHDGKRPEGAADRELNGTIGAAALSGSSTLVSRFLDAGPSSSKTGTPSTQTLPHRPKQVNHVSKDSTDMKRNQSTPVLSTTPFSPPPPNDRAAPGTASGSATPSAAYGQPLSGGRIQAKLWLQRGLSELESRSQSNLSGMTTPGGRMIRPGGGIVNVADRVERELRVVRRYRYPIEESMERLKKLKDSPIKPPRPSTPTPGNAPRRAGKAVQAPSIRDGTRTPTSIRDGARTPTSSAPKSSVPRASPPAPATQGRTVSFALATPDEEDAPDARSSGGTVGATAGPSQRSQKDWESIALNEHEGLRELEDVTLDVRRQMWELLVAEE